MIKSLAVTSQVECSLQCLRQNECKSWNLIQTLSGFKCELNDATIENGIETILARKRGAIFGRRLDNVGKKVNGLYSFILNKNAAHRLSEV